MYYVSIDTKNSNKLAHYCRNCGDIDDSDSTKEMQCVLTTHLSQEEQKFHHIMNKYTKLDPTLPRIYSIPCPNEQCPTNKTGDEKKSREVIYIRYDQSNLKYLYMCTICNQTWHS